MSADLDPVAAPPQPSNLAAAAGASTSTSATVGVAQGPAPIPHEPDLGEGLIGLVGIIFILLCIVLGNSPL